MTWISYPNHRPELLYPRILFEEQNGMLYYHITRGDTVISSTALSSGWFSEAEQQQSK